MKKWLCEFKLDKLVDVKKSSKSKDEKGVEIEIVKTLKKKEPHVYKLQKPTRKQFEEGELFYAIKLSEGIKAGLLTTAQVAKRYENDGGVFTNTEKARLKELRSDISELQAAYFKLEGPEEETNKEKIKILSQINDFRIEISEIENVHQYIYDQTAEIKARNKTILWWILQLAHEVQNNKESELFGKGNAEEKLEEYDKLEEKGDDFSAEILKKLAYYVSYWYVSKNIDSEDFKTVESLYVQNSNYTIVEDEDEEEKKVEPTKVDEPKSEEAKPAEVKPTETKPE